MQADDRDSRYVSQSETKDAHDCGVRWFGSWGLNYRPQHPESLPQRVGSLGHAALAGSMLNLGREWAGTTAVMLDEAKKRGYLKPDATEDDIGDDLRRDMDAAARAAELMLSSKDFNPGAIARAPSLPAMKVAMSILASRRAESRLRLRLTLRMSPSARRPTRRISPIGMGARSLRMILPTLW